MYPYLADFDSDGYDDIEAGEEDNFVKWDPVNGIHVPREVPLATSVQKKTDAGPFVAPEDNGPTQLLAGEIDLKTFLEADAGSAGSWGRNPPNQSLAGGQDDLNIFLKADPGLITVAKADVASTQILKDQIGLSILLEAAKAVSENGQDERNGSDDGDMPGPFGKHGDATDEASVVSDSVRYMSLVINCPVASGPHLQNDHFYPQ